MGESIEVISRGVLLDQDELLVCRDRLQGHIFLPGGHVEFGEPAADALVREIKEELGIDLEAGHLIGVCEASFSQARKSNKGERKHHEINLVFAMHPPHSEKLDRSLLLSQEQQIAFEWLPLKQLAVEPGRLLPTGIASIILQRTNGPRWLSLMR